MPLSAHLQILCPHGLAWEWIQVPSPEAVRLCIIRYLVSDAGMSVGKLVILPGFGRRFFVLAGREQITTSGLFEVRIAQPQAVHKVKIRTKWRKGIRRTADKHSKKVIPAKFDSPLGKTGKFTVKHKDKGA